MGCCGASRTWRAVFIATVVLVLAQLTTISAARSLLAKKVPKCTANSSRPAGFVLHRNVRMLGSCTPLQGNTVKGASETPVPSAAKCATACSWSGEGFALQQMFSAVNDHAIHCCCIVTAGKLKKAKGSKVYLKCKK